MTDISAALGLVQLERYPELLARRRALVAHYEAALGDLMEAGIVDILRHYAVDEAALEPASALCPQPPLSLEQAAALRHQEAASGHGFASSGHLMLVRLVGKSSDYRNALIAYMGEQGVATNVHYKPLPLLTAYKNLGFDIAQYPHAFAQYQNEISLPLHTCLSDDDVAYIVETFKRGIAQLDADGVR